MRQSILLVALLVVLLFPNAGICQTQVKVTSPIDGDVYIDNVLKGPLAAGQSLGVAVAEPGTHVVEVRARESRITHREEIAVPPNATESREIKAFSDAMEARPNVATAAVVEVTPQKVETTTTVETPARVEAPQPDPKAYVTREEMMAAIKEAKIQAKAEAKAETLAEESSRRKRANKRALTNKAIAHVVGVEANKGLPGSVKRMERIKILIESLPSFKK